jgi:hypothetical protein
VRLGDNARRGLAGPRRRAVDAAGYVIGLALAGLAAVRRGKAVHPHGAVYAAELVVPSHHDALGRTELFGTPGRRPALVRFSRSLGLPRPLPDLLGMSVRVLDAYGADRDQDFLMVTSIDAPVLHHLFVPARDVQQRPYSSSLPYRAGGETFLVGAVPRPESPRFEGGDELERLAAAAATGAPSCSTSPWQRCGDASGRWPNSAWQTRSRPRPTPCGSIRGTPAAGSSRRDC